MFKIFKVLRKFVSILSKHQRIRLIELTILMIIGGFLEMLSVSLMLPFVEVVMNPEKTMKNEIIARICGLIDIQTDKQFLVWIAVLMALIYIMKNIFLLFELTIQNKFVYNNMFITQQKLLRSYLMRPYEYYMDVKSGEVLRVIGTDTSQAYGILAQIVYFLSEIVVSASLLLVVFLMVPSVTVVMAAILLIITCIMLSVLKPILNRAGHLHQSSYSEMNQWILQSIQGIKEIKVTRCEDYFEKKFGKAGRDYVKSTYTQMTLNVIPRYMIEAIAMSTFFIIVGIMIYNGVEIDSLIPMISGVAMACIRLLPSVNRISVAASAVAFGEPAVDKMLENIKDIEITNVKNDKDIIKNENSKGTQSEIEFTDNILLNEITYKYPLGKANVIEKANVRLEKGKSIGFIGASGAGKTTVVDIILGLLNPQSGKVAVDGIDIKFNLNSWLSDIGYIPQSIFLLDGNIRENVAFGVPEESINDEMVWDALKEASLDEFVKNMPDGLNTQIGERGIRLSGGQKQRIGIARALYNDPQVLILDEATSALDNDTEAAIMDSINRLHGRKTMIIIAHRLTTIENCDEVYKVESGKILRVE